MKTCPDCNYSNTDDAKFCVACGKALSEEQTPRDNGEPFAEISPETIIENDTPFNQDALKKFYVNIKIGALVLFGCGALMILIGILDILFPTEGTNNAVLFICGGVMIVLGVVYLCLYGKATTNNKLVTDTSRQRYLFYEDGVKAVFSDMGVSSTESNITYNQISKVTRRKYFILIWFGSTVWLIDRSAFLNGSEEQLKYLLLRKCGEKIVHLD
jgi:hypothetical protein